MKNCKVRIVVADVKHQENFHEKYTPLLCSKIGVYRC